MQIYQVNGNKYLKDAIDKYIKKAKVAYEPM